MKLSKKKELRTLLGDWSDTVVGKFYRPKSDWQYIQPQVARVKRRKRLGGIRLCRYVTPEGVTYKAEAKAASDNKEKSISNLKLEISNMGKDERAGRMPALQEIANVMRGANKRLSRVIPHARTELFCQWEGSSANSAGTRSTTRDFVVVAA
ncbi:MAG: hypothetical protein WB723_03045 [Candidatus Acidiferrales bacterium]